MSKIHCIICHSDNVDSSDEHVIPEALGGTYHIYNVCKSCNSKIGTAVDIKLVDHILMKICRENNNLTGKTGKLPSFLCEQIVHPKTDENTKMKFYYDEEQNLKLKFITSEQSNLKDDGTGTFSITVDDSEKNKLDEIINKKRVKLGKKGLHLNISEPKSHSQKGIEVQGSLSVDLEKFKIGLLKIAYESLCDLCPDYEKDADAKEIASILKNVQYDKVIKYANIGCGFENIEIFDTLRVLQIDTKNKHLIYYIFLEQSGLYCFISLFETIFLGIKMSEINYIGKYCVYAITNDYKNKKCNKYRFSPKNGLELL